MMAVRDFLIVANLLLVILDRLPSSVAFLISGRGSDSCTILDCSSMAARRSSTSGLP